MSQVIEYIKNFVEEECKKPTSYYGQDSYDHLIQVSGYAETLARRFGADIEVVLLAALLHDIGHGPFSHTLESILRDSLNIDHVGLTEKLIFGEYEIFDSKEKEYIASPSVYEILDNNNIDKKNVIGIIKGDCSSEIVVIF